MENLVSLDRNFWQGKKVFITGHTGFKGTWLTRLLHYMGAEVTGYALPSPTEEGARLFEVVARENLRSIEGDVRDLDHLGTAMKDFSPEIVLHLAAQPIVLESYKQPVFTYETNVMGTVNVLECVRQTESVRSFLNVTTDKVYENKEWPWGYRENEPLDGYDPYSNSKSCSELVTHSYQKSFFADGRCAISTARAGNVIGGGDFAKNRIVPDCIRAALKGEKIEVRNPNSTRPYQHVLEPLCAYLLIAQAQYEDGRYADWYNVGPDECDSVTTGQLADIFCRQWGEGLTWVKTSVDNPHEANFLKLDCAKIKSRLGWQSRWHIEEALKATVDFAKAMRSGENPGKVMDEQIEIFLRRAR